MLVVEYIFRTRHGATPVRVITTTDSVEAGIEPTRTQVLGDPRFRKDIDPGDSGSVQLLSATPVAELGCDYLDDND